MVDRGVYRRLLVPPPRTFFLFGPRGTGKSTWLREALPDALFVDLLRDDVLWPLARDPGALTRRVEAEPAGRWIVLDEVQRLPALLREVHDLIARRGKRHPFALTGSSARKLRRGEGDLLAGRALSLTFFPLTLAELAGAERTRVDSLLAHGMLPGVRSEPDAALRVRLLESYVETYLTQEIRLEAVVRRLDSFVRFLEVAALANAQVVNTSGLARDAGVARPTVQGFFEVLVDTLVGTWLPAWRRRAKVKEVAHPKFYFFDPGVVRALAGRAREPIDDVERGHLLETLVLGELRAFLVRADVGGALSYWRTPSGSEVDFVWSRGPRAVGIEVKATRRYRTADGATLARLVAEGVLQKGAVVYLGAEPQRDGAIEVVPLSHLPERLPGLIG